MDITASANASCRKDEKAQQQASAQEQADRRNMLNNEKYSDVVFVCEDGKRVHSCRLVLCSRSPLLEKMLMNGMAETHKSEISLKDVSSTTLIAIFEFLYTGTILDSTPRGLRKMLEIISAARYFLLENLEEIMKVRIEATLKMSPNDTSWAAKNLSVAMDFPAFLEEMDWIPLQLVRVLRFKLLEAMTLSLLSREAFYYLLSSNKSDSNSSQDSGNPALSLAEYLQFRQIILWWACHFLIDPEKAEEIVNPYLPNARMAIMLLKAPPAKELSFPLVLKSPEHNAFVGDASLRHHFLEIKKSVESLFSMIDFRRIYPELLIKVIEPLDIVPPTQINAAVRFHALQRLHTFKQPSAQPVNVRWEYNQEIYRIGEDCSVIEKHGISIGFARVFNSIHLPYLYVWDIVIEQVCYNFYEVGICKELETGEPYVNGSSLTQQTSGWALRMDKHGTYINKGAPNNSNSWRRYGKPYGLKGAHVRVHLDLFHHSCSFSIDGEEFGVAWNNLPDGVYYPAVCLGLMGRVRIKLISGFDLE